MKIMLEIGNNSNSHIVLPVEKAMLAAELLSHATIYDRDGWSNPIAYKRVKEGLKISFVEDELLEPEDEKVKLLKKQNDDANTARWKAHNEAETAKKRVTELEGQLEAIKSVTVCTTKEPEPQADEPVEADEFGL